MSTPAKGHMPFPGHRTVAQIWARHDAAVERAKKNTRAMQYGFDPETHAEEAAAQ